METFTFEGKEGQILSAAKWIAEQPKAVFQIVHGIAEHKERYNSFCEYLRENGYSVYVHDHRGHGGSLTKAVGYTAEKNGWQLMVDEIRILSDIIKQENPNVPFFLFGHSMGSFLARTYAIQDSSCIDGLIVCATGGPLPVLSFIGHNLAKLQKAFIGGSKTGHLINKLSLGSYEKVYGGLNWLTRDKAIIEEYKQDELCGFIPTLSLFENLLYGTRFTNNKKNIRKMRSDLPVLLIAGDGDPVGSFGKGVKKVHKLFEAAGIRDLECKLYPGARHEILNETNKDEVYSDILNWLNRHTEEKK